MIDFARVENFHGEVVAMYRARCPISAFCFLKRGHGAMVFGGRQANSQHLMKSKSLLLLLYLSVGMSCGHAAISVSSTDSFSATNEGWTIGGAGVQPTQNLGASYPGQTGYLSHFSDETGSNSKWLMFNNQPDWTGDYNSAGVTGIRFWVNADESNQSSLDLRVGFNGPGGFFISDSQALTVADGWVEMFYSLDVGNFTHVTASGGSGDLATTLSGVSNFQIVEITGNTFSFSSNMNGFVRGDASVTVLQFDDISAVPEPSSFLFLACGFGCLIFRRR